MSAVALPRVNLDMRIAVAHTGQWLIGCEPCQWFPDAYFDEGTAKQDAYQHNVAFHDGAGVGQPPAMPLQLAEASYHRARGQRQIAQAFVLSLVAVLIIIDVLFGFPWFFIVGSVVIPAVVFTFYGFRWGVWSERERVAVLNYHGIRQAMADLEAPPPASPQT